jgi:hypothetical protein
MPVFDRLKCWVVICCAGCTLLLSSPAMAQSIQYKDMSIDKITLEIAERKGQLQNIEQRLAAHNGDLKVLQSEMDSLVEELARREQEFAESGVAPQAYAEVLVLLQTMRVQLKIDLAGLRARQEYLRSVKPAGSGPREDRLLAVEKKLDIAQRIRGLAEAMVEKAEKSRQSGVISLDELSKIKVDAENAAMRVVELELERTERIAALREVDQPTLAAIQQTGLEIAEKEARLTQVESQLKATAEKGPELLQTEIKRRMLGQLEQGREQVLAEISEQELAKRFALMHLRGCEEELARRKDEK